MLHRDGQHISVDVFHKYIPFSKHFGFLREARRFSGYTAFNDDGSVPSLLAAAQRI
jgi:hypothetical protein